MIRIIYDGTKERAVECTSCNSIFTASDDEFFNEGWKLKIQCPICKNIIYTVKPDAFKGVFG